MDHFSQTKIYTITWRETTVYKAHVEADSQDEALDALFDGSSKLELDHDYELIEVVQS